PARPAGIASAQARGRRPGPRRAPHGRCHPRTRDRSRAEQSFGQHDAAAARDGRIRVSPAAAWSIARRLRPRGGFCYTRRSDSHASGPNVRLLFGTVFALVIAAAIGLGGTWVALTRGSAYGGGTIRAWTRWPQHRA